MKYHASKVGGFVVGALLGALGCADRPRAELSPASGQASPDSAPDASPQGRAIAPIMLAVLSDVEGQLEPCGCSVRSAGGMDRVVQALADLRASGQPFALVVAGNSLYPASPPVSELARAQEQLKAEGVAASLARLAPTVIVPGPVDRQRGARQLSDLNASGVSLLLDADSGPGARRGLVARVGDRQLTFARAGALGPRRAELAVESLNVAFAHGDSAGPSAHGIADVVVHTGSDRSEIRVEDGALHLWAGRHTEELWLLRLWPGRAGDSWQLVTSSPVRADELPAAAAERRLLGAEQPRDQATRSALDELFGRIDELGLASARVELAHADPLASLEPAHTYVGSRNCAACHGEAYAWWQRSAHGRAFATLQARGRASDLACIRCHVTGFGEPGGAALGKLAELRDVGCESCHGPGGVHIQNPRAHALNVTRRPDRARCASCHDEEHSAAFDYEARTSALRAPGHAWRKSAPN